MLRILHISPHLGGGIGTVVLSWLEQVKGHSVVSLDKINDKAMAKFQQLGVDWLFTGAQIHPVMVMKRVADADIAVVHYWDHPMLAELFSWQLPPCRLVFWCHKNYPVPQTEKDYPDLFLNVSPVQGKGRYIWSTGNMEKFLNTKPLKHEGFNVGYVGTVDYKKIHPHFIDMCNSVKIPDVHFTVVGAASGTVTRGYGLGKIPQSKYVFSGRVDDVAPYLAEMNVFGYPLRPDHYGTCEQVLGEAMAAGVVPVVMDNPAERLIVTDGVDGFVAKTEVEYVACIEFLYRYPAIREHLAFNARQRAEKLYSIDRMVRKWEEVFDELMEQPKKERMPL